MMSLRSSAVHLVLLAPLLPSFVQSLPLSATANSRSERLVVFGDSFSDNGSASASTFDFACTYQAEITLPARSRVDGAWIASNGTWPPSFYYQHQFSNGPVWPTLVAKHTGLQLIDLAAGGATANNSFIAGFTVKLACLTVSPDRCVPTLTGYLWHSTQGFNSTVPVPSSQDQIDQYQADYTISRGDIYVDFIGANDA
jgi:phospholipase/lecithinase/hemolysin